MLLRLAKKVLSLQPFPRNNHRVIFLYHHIKATQSNFYLPQCTTSENNFIEQINFIRKYFNILSLEELLAKTEDGKRYASIVFDDGFDSFKNVAFPVLKNYKIPATVFVNQAAIEKQQLWVSNILLNADNKNYLEQLWHKFMSEQINFDKFAKNPLNLMLTQANFNADPSFLYDSNLKFPLKIYLDEQEIIDLDKKGIQFENHSSDHLVLSLCNLDTQRKQIMDNKFYLENLLAKDSRHFAIPFGKTEHFNQDTTQILQNNLYNYSNIPQIFDYQQNSIKNLIPRISLTEESIPELIFYLNRATIQSFFENKL